MFLLNSCSFWKIRNKLKVEFIIPFMNTSGPLNQLFETGRILVGQVVFANTVLVLPLCLIEYVREDLLSNFLTETAERLIIWERGQKVIQDLFWEQFVLLIWPKSGVGEGGGQICPLPFFSLVLPVLPRISIDSTAAAFLLRTTITQLTIKYRTLLISFFVKIIYAMRILTFIWKVCFVQFKISWSPFEFLSFQSLLLKKFWFSTFLASHLIQIRITCKAILNNIYRWLLQSTL